MSRIFPRLPVTGGGGPDGPDQIFVSRADIVSGIGALRSELTAGDVVQSGDVQFRYAPGASDIPDLQGFVPAGFVALEHWADRAQLETDATAALTAAATYLDTLMSPQGANLPSSEQLRLSFGPGRYVCPTPQVLTISGTGVAITGDGRNTVLHNINFRIIGDHCEIKDLWLDGDDSDPFLTNNGYGIEIDGNARSAVINNLAISRKRTGIRLTHSSQSIISQVDCFDCYIGNHVYDPSGDCFTNCDFTVSRHRNLWLQGAAGETKYTSCRFTGAGPGKAEIQGYIDAGVSWQNAVLDGENNVTESTVENYFVQCTFTTGKERSPDRTHSIVSIAEGSGPNAGYAVITTATSHELFPGANEVTIVGTAGYDVSEADVRDVLSPTQFVLDAAYVASETPSDAEIRLDAWDLVIHAIATRTDVNDQFFVGGNINYTKIKNGYNLQFRGVRFKQTVIMEDGQLIYFDRPGRGRLADSNKLLPVAGPGSDRGWHELIVVNPNGSTSPDGEEYMAIRTPHTASGVGANNLPVNVNEVRVSSEEAAMLVAGRKTSFDGDRITGATNVPVVNGSVTWNGSTPELVGEGCTIINQDATQTGQVEIRFDTPMPAGDVALPIVTALSATPGRAARLTGAPTQNGFVVGGEDSGSNARVDFNFTALNLRT